MKRIYEIKTKLPDVTIRAEESDCHDTIVLSCVVDREELLAVCITKEEWQELTKVGNDREYNSDRAICWSGSKK